MEHLNSDRYGNDIISYTAISLLQCKYYCDNQPSCVCVTYRNSNGYTECWLKYALSTLTSDYTGLNVYDKIGIYTLYCVILIH